MDGNQQKKGAMIEPGEGKRQTDTTIDKKIGTWIYEKQLRSCNL
jgi:hypothetical protein